MLKKSYILDFVIDAKFNIYEIKYLLDSAWGVTPLPPRKKYCLK